MFSPGVVQYTLTAIPVSVVVEQIVAPLVLGARKNVFRLAGLFLVGAVGPNRVAPVGADICQILFLNV